VLSPKSTQVVFRWPLREPAHAFISMVSRSVGTFKHFFGSEAEYLICTDEPGLVSRELATAVTVVDAKAPGAEFHDSRETWMKWTPRVRYAPAATEFYVDSDIFLLSEPMELREFIAGDGTDYLVTQEQFSETCLTARSACASKKSWRPIPLPRSKGRSRTFGGRTGSHRSTPRILGRRAGCDLTAQFRQQYRWWHDHLQTHEVDISVTHQFARSFSTALVSVSVTGSFDLDTEFPPHRQEPMR